MDHKIIIPSQTFLSLLLPPTLLSILCLLILHFSNVFMFDFVTELIYLYISFVIITVASTTIRFTHNFFMIFIAISFGWATLLNLGYLLTDPHLLVSGINNANLSVQFLAMNNGLEAFSFIVALYFLTHRINLWLLNGLFLLIVATLCYLVLSGKIPPLYVEKEGLTALALAFRKVYFWLSVVTLVLYFHHRKKMSEYTYTCLALSLLAIIFSNIYFLTWVDSSIAESIENVLSIFSYWFIYTALVRQTLIRPFEMLNRSASNYDNIPESTLIIDSKAIIQQANKFASTSTNIPQADLVQASAHRLFHNKTQSQNACPICSKLDGKTSFQLEIETSPNHWVECTTSPITGSYFGKSWVHVVRDITNKKMSELEIKQVNYELGERLKELTCLNKIYGYLSSHQLKIKDFLAYTANQLPPAFQYPDHIGATIESDWGTFHTEPKDVTFKHSLRVEFIIDNVYPVKIIVFYKKTPPLSDKLFLPEEKNLLNNLASYLEHVISKFLLKKRTQFIENRVKKNETQLESFMDKVNVGIYIRH